MYSKEEIMSIIESEGNTHSFTYRGINCSMKRNSLLVWCGYMDVPEEVIMEIYVHGGITYDNIEENGLRRYGFDCGHFHGHHLLILIFIVLRLTLYLKLRVWWIKLWIHNGH